MRTSTHSLRSARGGHTTIVLDGHLRVAALSSDGRELVLAFRGPGAILGELGRLGSPAPRTWSS
jgi:CRP-like cAMP-binding protein